MKNFCLAMGLAFVLPRATPGQIQYRVGGSFGRTLGGVTEQAEAVYGAEFSVRPNDRFAVELAVLQFMDHPEEERLGVYVTAALPITPVHLSVRYAGWALGPSLRAYALAGIGSYLCGDTDFEISGLRPGGPVTQTGELRVHRKDAWGYHLAVGAEWALSDSFAALVEYRYARMWSDAEISGLSADRADGQMAIDAFEKDFWDNNEVGILRVGLNWAL